MWHLSFRVKISVCCFYLLEEVSLQGIQTHHNLWCCDVLENVLPGKLTLVKKKSREKIILYVFDMGEMSQMLLTQLENTVVKKSQESSESGDKYLLFVCGVINIRVLWIFQISQNERFLQWLLSGLWYHPDRLCSPVLSLSLRDWMNAGETLLCR